MEFSRSALSKVCVVAATIFLVCLATGCATYRPSKVGRGTTGESFSLKGTGGESGRGIVNIAFCWFEIPHEVEARIRENDSGHPFSIVSNAFDAALGAANGAVWGAERAIGGACELALSAFPPYDPIMKPGYPPYLNSGKVSEEELQEDCQTE